jgi:hypothetical protein
MSFIPDFSRNRTLFGLRTNANVVARYDPNQKRIESVSSIDINPAEIEVADMLAFNIPAYVRVAGVPLFPSTYEIAPIGIVSYHSHRPPREYVQLAQEHDLNECTKELKYTVDLKKLAEFDRRRQRYPTSRSVMGGSASEYVEQLINDGLVLLKSETTLAWHWCHLLAFSLLPARRAQTKRNLICGTSAFNGQMASMEAAVKTFVYELTRPLALEITATCLANTHFGLRLRYRIFDRYSGESHTEYFDPFGAAQGDYSDYPALYDRLLERFAKGKHKTSSHNHEIQGD